MSVAADSLHFEPPAKPSLAMGVIGNCGFSALIDARGRIVWCCLPRFDGDPVFNALLEPQPAPDDATSPGARTRSPAPSPSRSRTSPKPGSGTSRNTAVLRTQLFDKHGQGIEITDFAPRFFRRIALFRPMTLVRRVRPIHGAAAHPRVAATSASTGAAQTR